MNTIEYNYTLYIVLCNSCVFHDPHTVGFCGIRFHGMLFLILVNSLAVFDPASCHRFNAGLVFSDLNIHLSSSSHSAGHKLDHGLLLMTCAWFSADKVAFRVLHMSGSMPPSHRRRGATTVFGQNRHHRSDTASSFS